MRVSHIAPSSTDYTVEDNVYESPVYDIYTNDNFTNYCTTKSRYGLDLLGDGTWTGLNRLSVDETEAGFVDATDRFVDTSARVILALPILTIEETAKANGVTGTITVYTSDTEEYPEDWVAATEVESGQELGITKSERYVRFAVTISNPNGYAITSTPFSLYVRVETDKPVMAPLYERTRLALDKLPEWMAMREIDNDPEEFGLATPETVGGKFVNALMGEWLDKIAADLSYLNLQLFIDTVDLNQPDWVYEWNMSVDWFSRIVNYDGLELAQACDVDEFLYADADADIFVWIESENKVLTRKNYGFLRFYQGSTEYVAVETSSPFHVWNYLDEIGLLVDLERLYEEGNENYRKRILDVYANKPGPGIESFKFALRRELDLWRADGATPDSDYFGATPEVLEISDLELDPNYVTPRGLATDKFIALVSRLAKEYPTTWGRFYWGKSYWDIAGEDYSGFDTLPTQFDATPLSGDEAEYGIGDHNDLYLYRPDDFTGPHDFSVKLTARGRRMTETYSARPTVKVDFKLTGYADVIEYQNPTEEQWVTVVVVSPGNYALYHQALLSAASNVSFTNPTNTPDGYAKLEIFDSGGELRQDISWFDAETQAEWDDAATPHSLHVSEIESIVLTLGKYNPATEVLTDEPTYDAVDVFFSTTELDSNGEPTVMLNYGFNDLIYADDPTATPSVYMRSRTEAVGTGEWHSEPQYVTAEVNGALDNSVQNYVLTLPTFEWPLYLADPANKKCLVEIYSQDENGNYGGYTVDGYGDPVFLDHTHLMLDADNTWPEDGHGAFVTYGPDSTDPQLLVADDFDRPDSDWVGFTSPTGPDGFPISGGVAWGGLPDVANPGIFGIRDGKATGIADESDTMFTARGAFLMTDMRPGYFGASFSDPVQGRLEASIGVSEEDPTNLVVFLVRGFYETNDAGEIDNGNSIYIIFGADGVTLASVGGIELATPLETSASYDYGTGELDVRVDVIGDVVNVYVEGDLHISASTPEEYWPNSIIGIQASVGATIDNFTLEGLTTKEFEPTTVEIGVTDSPEYPLPGWGWETFEQDYTGNYIKGIVDENGPWRNDVQPLVPSSTFIWKVLNLSRDDFNIPNDDYHVVTWIGVKTAYGARSVLTWLDSNIVQPAIEAGELVYPENAIEEIFDEDLSVYGFSPIVIKARLRPEPATQWYPQMNAGWYYLGDEERYAYANRKDELIDPATPVLEGVPRQGAPVMVYTANKQLLTSDSFNRPDDTSLGFTDGDGLLDPLEWEATNFEVIDNQAHGTAGFPDSFAALPVDFDDFELRFEAGFDSEAFLPAYVFVRGDLDVFSGYVIACIRGLEAATPQNSAFDGVGYSIGVVRYEMGAATALGFFSLDEYPRTFVVSFVGNELSLHVNGKIALSTTDETFTSGKIAFASMDYKGIYDNIEVYSIDPDVDPVEYRQVSFVDPETLELTMTNTEYVRGNGTTTLYAAYTDIYDIVVHNITTDTDVTDDVSVGGNEINVSEATSTQQTYRITYKVANSFALHLSDAPQEASVEFDELPEDNVTVTYEESVYNPAQILDLPLSPMHTRIEEGYVFISENEYDLDRIEISYSPQRIVANGSDFLVFNIRTVDRYGNPKGHQSLSVSSDWGILNTPTNTITTNSEGFAQILLRSSTDLPVEGATPGPLVGTLSVDGYVDLDVEFEIQPTLERLNRLTAVPSAEELPADGLGNIFLYGKLTTPDLEPIAGEEIVFRKARTLYEAFTSDVVEPSVITNDEGEFEIGPFTVSDPDSPGLWFVVVETEDQSAGDVVFWREYPMAAFGIDDMTGLPIPDVQMATPISDIPPYAYGYTFPYSYDEDVELPATPTTVEWAPPRWYMLEWFLQYQLGIISSEDRYTLSPGYPDEVHGPYRL